MKKTRHDVWIFTLPSGLEIHLRDVPQKDLDFLVSIEQKTTRVAELEAVLRECREAMQKAKYSGTPYTSSYNRAIAKIDEVLNGKQ